MWVSVLLTVPLVGCVAFSDKVKEPHPTPITGSWFKDRFTAQEWNTTLADFLSVGGDTVMLQAPPLTLQTKDEISRDPDFAWCGSDVRPSGIHGTHCTTQAQQEMDQIGAKIQAWATFQYEEDFSEKLLMCKYDKIIKTSRIYFKLVFPITKTPMQSCEIGNGTDVVVVLTSFAGVDPHRLLVERAAANNVSVVFSLPAAPQLNGTLATPFMSVYFDFTARVLQDQHSRYTQMKVRDGDVPLNGSMYDVISAYHSSDETALTDLLLPIEKKTQNLPLGVYPYLDLYSNVAKLVHQFGKKLIVSPYVQPINNSVQTHVAGFQALANAGCDIIAVEDGACFGRGGHYYESQKNHSISDVDPSLYKVLKHINPALNENITFGEMFTTSNLEIFAALGTARDELVQKGQSLELWADLTTCEYLWDDPCAPADRSGSGINQLLNRASKSSVDMAIAASGGNVQKIVSYSWDPGYTCKTQTYNHTLLQEMYSGYQTPIIVDCRWHSSDNMSVVVIGFNLLGLTQSFQIKYQTDDGKWHEESQHGYYFEADYGTQHDRVGSLIYTQLYDLWNIYHIKPHGHVLVKADGAPHPCIYTY